MIPVEGVPTPRSAIRRLPRVGPTIALRTILREQDRDEVIGVGEMAATAYVGAAWPVAVPFLVIIVVLITRPQGLLGTRLREDAVA